MLTANTTVSYHTNALFDVPHNDSSRFSADFWTEKRKTNE